MSPFALVPLALIPLACSDAAEQAEDGAFETNAVQLAVEADCTASTYEAETMFHSVGGATPGGWNVWTNGYISTTHDFEGGTTQLTAVVAGQSGGGAAPNMVITVDGQQVHQTAVGSSSWTPYNVTFEAEAGEQEVRIYFTNDYYFGGQDRNLLVDKLTIGCGTGLCGNGAVDPGEECDDGSQTSADSCKLDCTWNVCGDGVLYTLLTDVNNPNALEACDDGNGEDGDACTNACTVAECGDGIVHEGVEECDDGNEDDDDACSNSCEANGECGDGVVDEGEACDDGNDVETDDCLATCEVAACGDGYTQEGEEECDDGNSIDDDACANDCTINEADTCGNGSADAGEECDDGNDDDTDSCTTECLFNACGDGYPYLNANQEGNPNPLEECDDGNEIDDDACSNTCEINSYCGDGIIDDGEECDDGNDVDTDGCTSECATAACGDGIVYAGVEECDDGNTVDDDACSNTCEVNGFCGDGNLDEGEECDDANDVDTDACTSECLAAVCGDGFVYEGTEECDDGNEDAGDGCDASCLLEAEPTASATLSFTNTWPTGYCVTLDVTNESDAATTSWTAAIELNGATIYTQWNGNFSGNSGEVNITPVGWNSVIAAGGTNSSVGFCANRAVGGPDPGVVSAEGMF